MARTAISTAAPTTGLPSPSQSEVASPPAVVSSLTTQKTRVISGTLAATGCGNARRRSLVIWSGTSGSLVVRVSKLRARHSGPRPPRGRNPPASVHPQVGGQGEVTCGYRRGEDPHGHHDRPLRPAVE